MSTLAGFLLARIAEDEEVAKHCRDAGGDFYEFRDGTTFVDPATRGYLLRYDTGRVLAECEAKRQIVFSPLIQMDSSVRGEPSYQGERLLRTLALPYADHPDYREEEWQP